MNDAKHDTLLVMSFENEQHGTEKRKRSPFAESLRGVAFGTAILGAAATTDYIKDREMLDAINSHVLTPSLIHDLKVGAGASDAEIDQLEIRLKPLVLRELKELRNSSMPLDR